MCHSQKGCLLNDTANPTHPHQIPLGDSKKSPLSRTRIRSQGNPINSYLTVVQQLNYCQRVGQVPMKQRARFPLLLINIEQWKLNKRVGAGETVVFFSYSNRESVECMLVLFIQKKISELTDLKTPPPTTFIFCTHALAWRHKSCKTPLFNSPGINRRRLHSKRGSAKEFKVVYK